jgi:hypothetical protein
MKLLPTTSKVAELNDRFCNSALSIDPVAISLGKKFMTSGIQVLGRTAQSATSGISLQRTSTEQKIAPKCPAIWRISRIRAIPMSRARSL